MKLRSRFKNAAVLALVFWISTLVSRVWIGDGRSWEIRIARGGVTIVWGKIYWLNLNGRQYCEYTDGLECGVQRRDGFGIIPWPVIDTSRNGNAGSGNWVLVPFSPILLPIVASGAGLWWRDRRIPVGHCQSCGYNLRANMSGTCPECGQRFRGPVSFGRLPA